jgi:hypothetical protein
VLLETLVLSRILHAEIACEFQQTVEIDWGALVATSLELVRLLSANRFALGAPEAVTMGAENLCGSPVVGVGGRAEARSECQRGEAIILR